MATVKFQKFCVTNGSVKARVFYCLDNRADGRKCVTLYAKDYSHALGKILGDCYENDTDITTDYFDEGRSVLFEDHPFYAVARARAEQNKRENEAKYSAKRRAAKPRYRWSGSEWRAVA